jgi:hypothetical protein
METRAAHLAWCKQRALEYINQGDLANAFASLTSDLSKHPDTENHLAISLGMRLLVAGHLTTAEAMRTFINGVN